MKAVVADCIKTVQTSKNKLHFYVLYLSENTPLPPSRPPLRATHIEHIDSDCTVTVVSHLEKVSYIFYSNEYMKKKNTKKKTLPQS